MSRWLACDGIKTEKKSWAQIVLEMYDRVQVFLDCGQSFTAWVQGSCA